MSSSRYHDLLLLRSVTDFGTSPHDSILARYIRRRASSPTSYSAPPLALVAADRRRRPPTNKQIICSRPAPAIIIFRDGDYGPQSYSSSSKHTNGMVVTTITPTHWGHSLLILSQYVSNTWKWGGWRLSSLPRHSMPLTLVILASTKIIIDLIS